MFSFTQNRYTFYAIALTLFVLSLLSPLFLKLNLGIDLTGGIQIEYNVSKGKVEQIIASKDTLLAKVKELLPAEAK
jgi:preprotein translocase subunit SecF